MIDQCNFPRCMDMPSYGYLGKDICTKHWVQLCEADSKTEKGLLKKIGLIRNDKGSVVSIKGV